MDQVLPDTHMEGQDEGFGSDLSSGYLGTEPADGRYLSVSCLVPTLSSELKTNSSGVGCLMNPGGSRHCGTVSQAAIWVIYSPI